jgi:hypothetical protein
MLYDPGGSAKRASPSELVHVLYLVDRSSLTTVTSASGMVCPRLSTAAIRTAGCQPAPQLVVIEIFGRVAQPCDATSAIAQRIERAERQWGMGVLGVRD